MKKIISFVRKQAVLVVAWILAIISIFFVKPDLKYLDYIDWRSLGILWSLMVVMGALRLLGVFEGIGKWLLGKVKRIWQLSAVLIFLCFFFSMIVTNDVALITFVPFAIMILEACNFQQLMIPLIVLQTIAANLGSMLTPIGNPQNLYLFGLSGFSLLDFIKIMFPYSAFSFTLLLVSVLLIGIKNKGKQIQEFDLNKSRLNGGQTPSSNISPKSLCSQPPKNQCHEKFFAESTQGGQTPFNDLSIPNSRGQTPNARIFPNFPLSPLAVSSTVQVIIFAALTVLAILSVLHLLPVPILFAVILVFSLVLQPKAIIHADYALLLTFIGFFIFTGNIARIDFINSALQSAVGGREVLFGILVSQIISNVPAALLLSGFSSSISDLVVGVNLGGLGTLIASMASLISYKFYASSAHCKSGKYVLVFTVLNLLFLVVLAALRILM